jgi:glycosyltransferase involved in cell wall biosynthesis
VAVFIPAYSPAYMRGGPIRSIEGLVETLGDEWDFRIVTSAYDSNPDQQLVGVEANRWTNRGGAIVWYSRSYNPGFLEFRRLLAAVKPDLIYLNSLFDTRFSLKPLLLARVSFRGVPILLAPRGELSPGALSLKTAKKKLFLRAFKWSGMSRQVIWHASSPMEEEDISREFGRDWFKNSWLKGRLAREVLEVRTAPDLRAPISSSLAANRNVAGSSERAADFQDGGALQVVFLSRIVPKKNLLGLIESLRLLEEPVHLTVAGPVEDEKYWLRCLSAAGSWDNGSVLSYVGPIDPNDVLAFLASGDLFVLPTLGENYGHVILEAILAGTPVIVGRDTPWSIVEEYGAGWLCDPTDGAEVANRIRAFQSMGTGGRLRMRVAAARLGAFMSSDVKGPDANRALFSEIVSLGAGRGGRGDGRSSEDDVVTRGDKQRPRP